MILSHIMAMLLSKAIKTEQNLTAPKNAKDT